MEDKAKEVLKAQPQDLTESDLKEYMRIDFDDEENDKFISTLLVAAKSIVQNYLNWKFEDREEVPQEITIAILAISEHWYKNRGILSEDTSKQELPFVFTGILDLHRFWNVGAAGGADA